MLTPLHANQAIARRAVQPPESNGGDKKFSLQEEAVSAATAFPVVEPIPDGKSTERATAAESAIADELPLPEDGTRGGEHEKPSEPPTYVPKPPKEPLDWKGAMEAEGPT